MLKLVAAALAIVQASFAQLQPPDECCTTTRAPIVEMMAAACDGGACSTCTNCSRCSAVTSQLGELRQRAAVIAEKHISRHPDRQRPGHSYTLRRGGSSTVVKVP